MGNPNRLCQARLCEGKVSVAAGVEGGLGPGLILAVERGARTFFLLDSQVFQGVFNSLYCPPTHTPRHLQEDPQSDSHRTGPNSLVKCHSKNREGFVSILYLRVSGLLGSARLKRI